MKKHFPILLCMCAAGLPAMAAPAPASSLPELQLLPRILNGEDVNISLDGMKGNTCLHYACELGSRDLIRWLVENGAEWGAGKRKLQLRSRTNNLCYCDFYKKTLLEAFSAAKKARENKFAAQLQNIINGGNVDDISEDESGNTALIYAAYKGIPELVETILQGEAPIDVRNKEGWNAITLAAFKDRTECIKTLLSKGADIESRTASGSAPLMLAAMFGHLDTLKLLLDEHADINATTPDGHTALYLAEQKGQTAAAALLREYEAK